MPAMPSPVEGAGAIRRPPSGRGAVHGEGGPGVRLQAEEGGAVSLKRKQARDRAYLDWIAAKPCIWCNKPGPSHPSHFGRGGTALKSDDYKAIPLCDEHHIRTYHRTGQLGHMTHEQTVDWATREALELVIEWIQEGRAADGGGRYAGTGLGPGWGQR